MRVRHALLTVGLLICATVGLLAQSNPPFGMLSGGSADTVTFTSKPSPTARVNESYMYTATAVSSNPGAVIRYYARLSGDEDIDNQAHLMIDSVTGVVDWTPTMEGWFAIRIVAMSSMGGHAVQNFTVLVSGGNGTIQGRVTDTMGTTGIPNVLVQALRATVFPMMGLVSGLDHDSFFYSAKTDSNGYYRISHVDPGLYKLHAVSTSTDFESQWYDGVDNPIDAQTLTVADSPAVLIADFRLRSGAAEHPKVTVSGRVTDSLGMGLRVPGEGVFFVRSGFALNANSTVDDFRDGFDSDFDEDFHLGGHSRFVFSAKVDSNGDYHLSIPTGNYIAFAVAPGFAMQFYKGQASFLSANVMALQSDSGNIDFTLLTLPSLATGGISGTILDTAKGVGVRARVMAFRDRWMHRDDFHVSPVYTTDTDTLGNYSFTQLLPGSYIVFAVPVGDYAPAYYTSDTSSIRWKHATPIAINGNTVSGINIFVRPLGMSMQGFTSINGTVRVDGQGTVAGAFVYATAGGQVSGYAITDNSGNYSISGLAPGTYSVSVDKTGFDEVASQSVTVSYFVSTTSAGGYSSTPVTNNADFSLSSTPTVTSVTPSSNVVRQYTLGQNYPNPFNPATTITFDLPQTGMTTLKVFNILGQEVTTLVNKVMASGSHQVTFSALNLGSGVYFYQLKSGNFTQTRKMVLLK